MRSRLAAPTLLVAAVCAAGVALGVTSNSRVPTATASEPVVNATRQQQIANGAVDLPGTVDGA